LPNSLWIGDCDATLADAPVALDAGTYACLRAALGAGEGASLKNGQYLVKRSEPSNCESEHEM
jgi:hypothetical protein